MLHMPFFSITAVENGLKTHLVSDAPSWLWKATAAPCWTSDGTILTSILIYFNLILAAERYQVVRNKLDVKI